MACPLMTFLCALILVHSLLASRVHEEPRPLIPEIVEHGTPALLAYWEVTTIFSRPQHLIDTIDRRAQMRELPMHHFYSLLRAYRDDASLKAGWECAGKGALSARHARDTARKIASSGVEHIKDVLLSLGDAHAMSIEEVRQFEDIKGRNPNYHISLVKMARARMDEVRLACPSLASAMAELAEALVLKPDDIKEDNEMMGGGQYSSDQAPLIAMTVIGIASILLNVLQGVMTVRRDCKQTPHQHTSPLQHIHNK